MVARVSAKAHVNHARRRRQRRDHPANPRVTSRGSSMRVATYVLVRPPTARSGRPCGVATCRDIWGMPPVGSREDRERSSRNAATGHARHGRDAGAAGAAQLDRLRDSPSTPARRSCACSCIRPTTNATCVVRTGATNGGVTHTEKRLHLHADAGTCRARSATITLLRLDEPSPPTKVARERKPFLTNDLLAAVRGRMVRRTLRRLL